MEPIAIVGMACRFPGAPNLEAYWSLLTSGQTAITEVPPERWDLREYYDPDPTKPGKMTCRHGGFLPAIDQFDHAFFGISPREAAQMDPQQRLLLEVTWEALESAGIPPDSLARTQSGVYVGIMNADYGVLQTADLRRIDPHTGPGSQLAIASNRLSYTLDLRGPSLSVDTACSSSLVALHLACQALRTGDAGPVAIVGGANLTLSPVGQVFFSKAGVLTQDGRCRPFDAAANGFARGEGAGVVILKTLSQALADGDRIWAVIQGSAVNQDGRTNGLMAPNRFSQEAVLRAAYQSAGISPGQIQYVEAHGTATLLGDPIEVKALGAVLAEGRAEGAPCLIGSVKSQIGHLESAAGIASLIKVALMMDRGMITPTANFERPNPHIPFDQLPIKVAATHADWPRGETPRLAGVSSFGFGGTNAHVVLAEAPQGRTDGRSSRDGSGALLLPVSARTKAALSERAASWSAHLASHPGALAPILKTAAERLTRLEHRLAVVAADQAEAEARLAAFAKTGRAPNLTTGRALPGRAPRIAFLFSGQGTQWWGMGRELLQTEPTFRAIVEQCSDLLQPLTGWSLLDELLAPESSTRLGETVVAQPALFALQVALTALLADWSIIPAAVAGHSVGEIAAAHIAGILSLPEAIRLVYHRSRLMQRATGLGRMLALEIDPAEASDWLEREPSVSLAALNGPRSTVLAGAEEGLQRILERAQAEGYRALFLPVNYAFHSPQMEPLQAELVEALTPLQTSPSTLPFISTALGRETTDLSPEYWAYQMRNPVRFADGVDALIEAGCTTFVEIGPNPVLNRYIREQLAKRDRSGTVLATLRRDEPERAALLGLAGALWSQGAPLAWSRVNPSDSPLPASLPPYPWQHESHWFVRSTPSQPAEGHPLLGAPVAVAEPTPTLVFHKRLRLADLPYLRDHCVQGAVVMPGAAYLELAIAAGQALFGSGTPLNLHDFRTDRALFLREDEVLQLQISLTPEEGGGCTFSIHSAEGEELSPAEWRRHADGRLEPGAREDAQVALAERVKALHPADASDYYLSVREKGLEYGPNFRSIQALWTGPGEALGRLEAPSSLLHLGAYAVHPALLDACGHLMLAAAPDAPAGIYLPVGATGFTWYHPFPERLWSHVQLHANQDPTSAELVGDITICDDDGNLLMEMKGLRFRRLGAPVERTVRGWQVEWRPVTPGEERAARSWHVWGQGRLADELVEALRGAGAEATILGRTPSQLDGTTSPASDLLLWLDPPTDPAALPDYLCQLERLIGCLDAPRPPCCWFVTRGAVAVQSSERTNPAATALWGFARTLQTERPSLWGGLIDLANGEELAGLAKLLTADLPGDQLALRAGQLYLAQLTAAPRPADEFRCDPTASYLVTGGLGGLGLALGRWLVDRGARSLILLGRRTPQSIRPESLPPESPWYPVASQIAALQAAGCEVTVDSVDVTDEGALSAFLARWPRPIRGVIHAAGTAMPTQLGSTELESVQSTFAPKALGATYLAKHLGESLDLFLLVSSASALLPSPGLWAYAAANAWLDGFAQNLRASGQRAISVGWGPWAEVGMAARSVQPGKEALGALRLLTPAEALRPLGALLQGSQPAIALFEPSADWHALGSVTERPFLQAVQAEGGQVRRLAPSRVRGPGSVRTERPTTRPSSIDRQAAPTGRQSLVNHLAEAMAAVLHLRPDQVDPDQSVLSLGFDSLMLTELRSRVEAKLSLSLPLVTLLQGPSLNDLADLLLPQLPDAPVQMGASALQEAPAEVTLYPLSVGQQALWSLHQLNPETSAYHILFAGRADRPLDPERLRLALGRLIERHTALRTTFRLEGDRPVQVVHPHLEPQVTSVAAAGDLEGAVQAAAQAPFDLVNGPLIRLHLIEDQPSRPLLLMVLHHLVGDYWSLAILVDELGQLYNDLEVTLPPATPFHAVVDWQEELLRGPEGERLRRHWSAVLAGDLPILELPTDHPRPPVQSHRGGAVRLELPLSLGEAVESLAVQEGVTPFVLFLASYLLLLHRYGGTEELIVGLPTANRNQQAFANTVGYCANPVPLRSSLSGDLSFRTFLHQVKESSLQAIGNQELPFGAMLDLVRQERDPSRSPIFQALFAFQRAPRLEAQSFSRFMTGDPTTRLSLPGFTLDPYPLAQQEGQFDLTLSLIRDGAQVAGALLYNADLFKPETIARMGEHWVELLRSAVTQPDAPLGALSMLTAQDAAVLANAGINRVPPSGEAPRPVHEEIRTVALRQPDALALSCEGESLTYGELESRANQLAWALGARGVGPGSIVGIYLPRSTSFAVAILAVWKAGATYLPLDPGYPPERITLMLADSGASLILTDATTRALLSLPRLDLEEDRPLIEAASTEPPLITVDPAATAYLIYTSGSTGTPKGVAITHRSFALHAAATVEAFGLTGSDRVLQFASFNFDTSLEQLIPTLIAGGSVLLRGPDLWSAEGLLEQVGAHGLTVANLPTAYWHQLVGAWSLQPDRPFPDSLRLLIIGGEAMQREALRTWQSLPSSAITLLNAYGPTETTVTSHLFPVPPDWQGSSHGVPIGRAFGPRLIRVLDVTGQPAPIGVPGELLIGGPLAGSYWKRPDLNAERFIPDPWAPAERLYRTGDKVRILPDGDLLFLGRSDGQVKLRGFRIELGEIEAQLLRHADVTGAVAGLYAEPGGEPQLIAWVATAADPDRLIPALKESLGAALPSYMVPAQFVPIERVPLTPNGKVDRRALSAPQWQASAGSTERPTSPVEAALAQIWSVVLNRQLIGRHDSFFSLGGDSILAIQVVARAAAAGYKLQARHLFTHPTIAELARVAEPIGPRTVEPPPSGEVPLSPIQSWFFARNLPAAAHWNQAIVLTLRPERREVAALSQALSAVASHHDAFRLRFEPGPEGWVQAYTGAPAWPMTHLDLSDWAPDAQEKVYLTAADQLQRSLDLTNGPLGRALLVERGQTAPPLLLLALHHLICDGLSWRILLEDLETAYSQALAGQAIELPPRTSSYQRWSESLAALPYEYLEQEAERWRAQVALERETLAPATLPTEGEMASLSVTLDPATSEALLAELPRLTKASTQELLLLALAEGLRSWGLTDAFLVELEGHGRDGELDLGRTVGWFTATYPFVLPLSAEGSLLDRLRQIKARLRAIGETTSWSLLQQRAPELVSDLPKPQLLFNYLGRFDQAQRPGGLLQATTLPTGRLRGETNPTSHPLTIDSLHLDGALHLTLSFAPHLYAPAQVTALGEAIVAALRALAQSASVDPGPALDPSDFPLVPLTPDALAAVRERLPHLRELYPLAPSQVGILYATLVAEGPDLYVAQIAARLDRLRSPAAFRDAWAILLQRHPALRTGFVWQGLNEPAQAVSARVELPWEELDWQGMAPAEQEAALTAHLEAERFRSFDLSQPPLMRLQLIQVGSDAYYLVWTHHHLIMDGWSLGVAMQEVLTLYGASVRGEQFTLADPLPFSAYQSWLREQDETASLRYWTEALAGAQPTLLRPQAVHPTAPSVWAEEELVIEPTVTEALDRAVEGGSLTLGGLLHGAWALLLHAELGRTDLLFGTIVSGRPATLPGVEGSVGLYINTLPVRTELAPALSLAAWLRALTGQMAEARQHEFLPLARLQGTNGPLFDTIVNVENYPLDPEILSGGSLQISQVRSILRTGFPLILEVSRRGELTCQIEYDPRRFDPWEIRLLLRLLQSILGEVVDQLDRPLGELLHRVAALRTAIHAAQRQSAADALRNRLRSMRTGGRA